MFYCCFKAFICKDAICTGSLHISIADNVHFSRDCCTALSVQGGYKKVRDIVEPRILSDFKARNDYSGVFTSIHDVVRGSNELKCCTLDFQLLNRELKELSDYTSSWIADELSKSYSVFNSTHWYKLVDRAEFVPQKRGILLLRCEQVGFKYKMSWVTDVSCTSFSSSIKDSYIFSQLDFRYASMKCNNDKGVCYTPIRLEEIFNFSKAKSSSDCFSLLKYCNPTKTARDVNTKG